MSTETSHFSPGVDLIEYSPSKLDWLLYHDAAVRIHTSRGYPHDHDLEENLAGIFTNPNNIAALLFNRVGLFGYGFAYPNPRNGIPNSAEVMYVIEQSHQDPEISLGIIRNLGSRLEKKRYRFMVLQAPAEDVPKISRHYRGNLVSSERSFPTSDVHKLVIRFGRSSVPNQR